ncbi:hypothetical protein BDK51DRAFT_51519, partial [Blyttiomyces helicus]
MSRPHLFLPPAHLAKDFDPASQTINELASILSQEGVTLPAAKQKRAFYIDLFNETIKKDRLALLQKRRAVRPSNRGIIHVNLGGGVPAPDIQTTADLVHPHVAPGAEELRLHGEHAYDARDEEADDLEPERTVHDSVIADHASPGEPLLEGEEDELLEAVEIVVAGELEGEYLNDSEGLVVVDDDSNDEEFEGEVDTNDGEGLVVVDDGSSEVEEEEEEDAVNKVENEGTMAYDEYQEERSLEYDEDPEEQIEQAEPVGELGNKRMAKVSSPGLSSLPASACAPLYKPPRSSSAQDQTPTTDPTPSTSSASSTPSDTSPISPTLATIAGRRSKHATWRPVDQVAGAPIAFPLPATSAFARPNALPASSLLHPSNETQPNSPFVDNSLNVPNRPNTACASSPATPPPSTRHRHHPESPLSPSVQPPSKRDQSARKTPADLRKRVLTSNMRRESLLLSPIVLSPRAAVAGDVSPVSVATQPMTPRSPRSIQFSSPPAADRPRRTSPARPSAVATAKGWLGSALFWAVPFLLLIFCATSPPIMEAGRALLVDSSAAIAGPLRDCRKAVVDVHVAITAPIQPAITAAAPILASLSKSVSRRAAKIVFKARALAASAAASARDGDQPKTALTGRPPRPAWKSIQDRNRDTKTRPSPPTSDLALSRPASYPIFAAATALVILAAAVRARRRAAYRIRRTARTMATQVLATLSQSPDTPHPVHRVRDAFAPPHTFLPKVWAEVERIISTCDGVLRRRFVVDDEETDCWVAVSALVALGLDSEFDDAGDDVSWVGGEAEEVDLEGSEFDDKDEEDWDAA